MVPEEINVHNQEPALNKERSSFGSAETVPPPTKLSAKFFLIPVILLIAVGVAIYFLVPAKVDRTAERRARPKIAAVTVATARSQNLPVEIRTTGNIQAYSIVNVVPQVSGQLMSVSFTQGQTVRKGDLLFQIDPRPYQAALAQAMGNVAKDRAQVKTAEANLQRDLANIGQLEANMVKDQASLKFARAEADRYRKLVAQGAISMQQAEQALTTFATAEAQIQADLKQIENAKAVANADRAQIDTARATMQADEAVAHNARIQLDWCTIRAPMDGRTGSLNIHPGNIVAANSPTPLVTIAQVQPIYVSFTVPESYLDQVRQALANNTLNIQASVGGAKANFVSGTASFLENTVNTQSGTALLRASFANRDLSLFPGQFVDVVVTMPADGDTVVVPATAIQTTQKGNSVYVVQSDNSVALVPVDLKRTVGELAAVGRGLKHGDTVVTDGQLQLLPGMQVKIVSGKPGAEAAESAEAPTEGRRRRGGRKREGGGPPGEGGFGRGFRGGE